MESRQRQVFFGNALVEQGLDVGLGVDAAAAGDVVDAGAGLRALVELLHWDTQQVRDLIDEGARAAGAAAVHAHVAYGGGVLLLIGSEEDHLRILAAELDGCACRGVELADGD